MEHYDSIISSIEERLPGARIYLMAYYPVNYEAAAGNMKECLKVRSNEKITAANALVKAIAEKHGQRYIDINKNLNRGSAYKRAGLQSYIRRLHEVPRRRIINMLQHRFVGAYTFCRSISIVKIRFEAKMILCVDFIGNMCYN